MERKLGGKHQGLSCPPSQPARHTSRGGLLAVTDRPPDSAAAGDLAPRRLPREYVPQRVRKPRSSAINVGLCILAIKLRLEICRVGRRSRIQVIDLEGRTAVAPDQTVATVLRSDIAANCD